jgi:hypothetical protein
MSSAISKLETVDFLGEILHNKDVSAIDFNQKFLLIGSDEGNQIQILKREGEKYRVIQDLTLHQEAREIDIEGIACEGDWAYVIGSHSAKRSRISGDESYADNRETIEAITPEPDRDRLFRFRLDDQGHVEELQETSLASVLDNNKLLRVFRQIPSKENGVDIEGIAVHDQQLYIGFRGPVLRENWVPVLKCRFANPVTDVDLIYVQLDGLGFRDITRVKKGFLILAGPVGDGPGSYHLYFWDGQDCLPGLRSFGEQGKIKHLGKIPTPKQGKAEGLALLKESSSDYEVLVVYDALKNGDPTRFKIEK